MTRIGQLMTRDPVTIRSGGTVEDASRLMTARGLRHLPVVDDAGRLIGIISDRDVRGPLIGVGGRAPLATDPIDGLITRALVTALADDPLGAVARRIVDEHIGAVPIVDEHGALLGIVSYVDVLRRLADDADADARALERIDGY